jgi:cytochrome c553
LQHFQSGIRVNAIMQGMAAALKPDEMKALGVYFSQQKPKGLAAKDAHSPRSDRSSIAAATSRRECRPARRVTRRTALACRRNYPRLAGQYAEYTYGQLKAFRDGERGADKEGKDYNGKIMATVAARMSDPQMKALAEYTSGLR